MNLASLMTPPRKNEDHAAPRRLQLVRIQATVLLQGAVSAAQDSVKSFRHMRDVLTGAYSQARA
ncbi:MULTISPECIES: hypothetical protein [Myxococcus]|uniref:Uncharacterized protein n=1 Tax=Myxococcus llanfairpwllgwyngyllgogerychwyrndrobwllllantysiliogogogochensis TaxID=2590453 RepID=A0A540WTI0_9BACT|nr:MULTISPECIES: hypothetical protein [Myxococcus]NTX00335.1 hypothetical protein [Myxococcus sp. CA040A]NTX15828.1 hypothetical protein [Myxococcus sp. CA056]TQF12319.1 hypothetical protein FJV41_29705 [Myxococcus llanfairpwllgwyngyllgogerychwyrndrobwllllantysiliogogogochensis]